MRDWWYSIQDLLAEKDICLHERKRVEIETIIKDTLTQLTLSHEAKIEQRVGMLRQWLNEDRIVDARNFVSNKELMFWLTGDTRYVP